MAEIEDLEVIDDDNTARFPEGQAPSTVNNGARQLEGIVARWHKDTNASKSSTGSANAYAFAADQALTAYYDGLEIAFDANFTNDGAATLDVDAIGAQSIVLVDGSALTGGEIVQGQKAIVIFDGTNWQLLNPSFSGLKSLPVGSTFPYVGTVAPSGFVLAEGRTIGNAASGGTERAADDTENLFTLIWDSTTDANAPVTPGGRGTDAASDFAANKTITLPDLRGRSVIGQGTGPDTADGGTAGEARANFEKGGAESYVLTTGQLPSGLQVYDGGSLLVGTDGSLTTAASPTRTAAGSDDPIDQMHPWQALTHIISLGTGLTTGAGPGSRDASNDTVIAANSVTARTLAARAADIINVLDYGAAGDGITDDTAAIQAALDATPSGTAVYMPAGTYVITGQINVNGKGILGAGVEATEIDASGLASDEDAIFVNVSQTIWARLENFNISMAGNGRDGLRISAVDHLALENIKVKQPGRDGVHVEASLNFRWAENIRAQSVKVETAGRDGFNITIPDTLTSIFCNEGVWINCEVRSCARHAIRCENASSVATSNKISNHVWINFEADCSSSTEDDAVWFQRTNIGDIEHFTFINSTFENVSTSKTGDCLGGSFSGAATYAARIISAIDCIRFNYATDYDDQFRLIRWQEGSLETITVDPGDGKFEARTDTLTTNFPSYTVAGLPSASTAGAGAAIYVSDETGGAVLAFSDGTNWRRCTDRAIVS